MMDTEKAVQDLNRRFAAPLPEFYKRRVVFWLDEDKEFEDKLDEIELTNAKIVKLTGSNTFAVKKLLCEDDTASNYVVYRPFSFEEDEDNWLLNMELYSEEFRSDLVSIWMDEMHIFSYAALRKQVKAYRKFFNAKDRRGRVEALAGKNGITAPAQLHKTVMAAICGIDNTNPNAIIRAIVSGGLDNSANSIYSDMVNYGAETAFWAMATQATGYREENPSIGRLITLILLTAATRTMQSEYLAGLDSFISTPHQSYCFDFISEWMHSDDNGRLYEIAQTVEEELRLPGRFDGLKPVDLADTECFPCINEIILKKMMNAIGDHVIEVDAISKIVEKRRTCVWYEVVQYYFDGIYQVANMQAFYKEHSAGFHKVEPKKIWNEYTSDYYKMDTYYRLFHLAFTKSLKCSNPELDDLFKHVAEIVEGLYSHWFLGELGNNWSGACAAELKEYGRILDVPQQSAFYNDKIKNSDNRVFVIISDALRFEVAASLCEQLRRETQAKVDISSMEGIFPTITKFGMAALLPSKELSIEFRNDKLAVLADGSLTESNYRDKILKNANSNSVAIQYKSIIKMKRPERSDLVKGMDVVYIYHDTIDEASHTSDSAVFPACQDTIEEIKNTIRIIVNDFGGTNVLITSDHGFLYTYSPLTEDNKVDKTSFNSQDVEYGRRYAIMKKGSNPDYLLPVRLLDGKTDYDGFAPRESIRIKMNGGGMNFVHGGISLEEMVVPVIEYHYLRNSTKEYKKNKSKYDTKPVSVGLLSANKKIANMIFSLSFYQKEAVSENREVAYYTLYFTDFTGKQISDTQKIIADKTSSNSQARTFRCNFNLKSLKFVNTETYYLVISEDSGQIKTQKEEFQINIALAVDDFDFFS